MRKTLKVKDLIKLLKRENPDADVLLAGDEEGNTFSYISETGVSPLLYEKGHDGEMVIGEKDELYNPKECVVLWPD